MNETVVAGKHMERAHEIAREVGKEGGVPVKSCARQGDLIVKLAGDPKSEEARAFAALLADGEHGEHWVITTKGGSFKGGKLNLPGGGVVVHTDKPSARHDALRLAPGEWDCKRLQELTLDGNIIEVKD